MTEFAVKLFELIEADLQGTPQQDELTRLFTVVTQNEFTCHECPHSSRTSESTQIVSLMIEDKESIEEALAGFVAGEILDDEVNDNSYKCDRCQMKRTATKQTTFKSLPSVLILNLKRLSYDQQT